MFYFHDMNVAAAARSLGLPEGTVKARLSRGTGYPEKEVVLMRTDDLDRWLSEGEAIVPSSGFTAGVMDAVHREALAPPPDSIPMEARAARYRRVDCGSR